MINKVLQLALLFVAFSSFSFAVESQSEKAHRIAKESLIVDSHIDLPMSLNSHWFDLTINNKGKQFDIPKAIKGGLNAPFMSIYTGSHLEKMGKSKVVAEQLIAATKKAAKESNGQIAIATSPDEVIEQFHQGIISFPMGMENGSPLEGKLENLDYFYGKGIRYLSFAHSDHNHISDSSGKVDKHWQGLSDFGKQLVIRMNQLGVMIDVSHVSDEAFWRILELSKAPVIASHSSSRRFTPGYERNMSDTMVKSLANKGGIIMINFGSAFLTQEAHQYYDAVNNFIFTQVKSRKLKSTESNFMQLYMEYTKLHGPFPRASLDDLLDHFDHLIKLAGIEHIGIGSDYHGVGPTFPIGLEDVSTYPVMIQGLLERGYSEAQIKKVLGENFIAVWRKVSTFQSETSTVDKTH